MHLYINYIIIINIYNLIYTFSAKLFPQDQQVKKKHQVLHKKHTNSYRSTHISDIELQSCISETAIDFYLFRKDDSLCLLHFLLLRLWAPSKSWSKSSLLPYGVFKSYNLPGKYPWGATDWLGGGSQMCVKPASCNITINWLKSRFITSNWNWILSKKKESLKWIGILLPNQHED